MPCEQRRILELQKEKERKRKKKKEEEKARRKKEQERFQKALAVVREKAAKWKWKLAEVRPNCFVASKPYSQDRIEIEVLSDGIIKTNTEGEISMPNHSNAEGFLKEVAQTLKGVWRIFHKHPHGLKHGHTHTHTH